MTTEETRELRAVQNELIELRAELKSMNEKIDCLLDGKFAHCATQVARITALEHRADEQAQSIAIIWNRIWWFAGLLITGIIGAIIASVTR